MFSVIIPTVQKKPKVLRTLVSLLLKDSSVDEIIIINNKPEKEIKSRVKKVRIITPKENLYVNSSWNLGITEIKNDNFVLMNDDLLVCKDFCKMVAESDVFNDDSTGLIGVSPKSINQFSQIDDLETPETENKPEFLPLKKHLGTGDWGVAIFGKKENYYHIPEDLKIIYGDNYLLLKNLQNNKKNFAISNIPFNHIHSSSSASPEFSSVIREDIINSKKYFAVTSPMEEQKYTLEFNNQICMINIDHTTIYLKYKNGDTVFSEATLAQQIFALARNIKMSLVFKIVKDIIARSTSC